MATVHVPPLMRDLTRGQARVIVPERTLGQVINALEKEYPGIKERLCVEGQLKSKITASVDGRIAQLGMEQPVGEHSEIRFLLVLAGG